MVNESVVSVMDGDFQRVGAHLALKLYIIREHSTATWDGNNNLS